MEIRIGGRNKVYYENLGYKCKVGDSIFVKVEDLPKTIAKKVKVQCDFCNEIFDRCYKDYIISQKTGSDACRKCLGKKVKETCIKKYGVEGVMCLEENKQKSIKTNLEKYGVENVSQTSYVRDKVRETTRERYGVEHIAQLQNIKDKKKKTNLLRYGSENPSSSKKIRQKIKEGYISKYGVEHPMQTEEVKEKQKQTMITRYGVRSYSQTDEYKIKSEETCMRKYGTKNVSSSPIVIEKRNKTLFKNKTYKTSPQQIELHKIIQEIYHDAKLNYPFGRSLLDIALILENNIKIDIEYDGWYWHQDKQKDRRRNYYNISHGWKVLRIKSGYKLPTKEELFEAIDYLINTERHYKEIILDDWKEPNKEEIA